MAYLRSSAVVITWLMGTLAIAAEPQVLPWQREVSLREAAKSVSIQGTLNPADPGRGVMSINNLKMHTVLWGPPDRITISINKNNVWDRRLHDFPAPTLQEITEGAFAPANSDYVGVKEIDSVPFADVDFLELPSFARKLAEKPDALWAFLSGKLDEKTGGSLTAYRAAKSGDLQAKHALLDNLVASLNALINGPPIYEAKLFGGVQLRPGTEALLKRGPQGRELAQLNRLLLEDGFPEISKRPGNSLRELDLGWLRKEGRTYVHTTITLELCLSTMAQTFRPAWDEWDYGGDVNFLKNECYPLMREMALFYAAFARKGDDGYYHIAPCMEEERWGIYPQFSRNKDIISSLCMFRWALTRAADAAELLGVDADLRQQWRQVAAQIAPYPTWKEPQGVVFASMPGFEPRRLPRDHQEEAEAFPTILADEINLDSPQEQKEQMLRTVRLLQSDSTPKALTLLAAPAQQGQGRRGGRGGLDAETLLNSRSGRIHLFPLPPASPDIAFHNFQASGGFLVSAAKNAQGVYFLEIEPRRDNLCRLMNPWPGKTVVVREVGKAGPIPVEVDRSNGECLIFSTATGHRYRVELSSAQS